ncbi:MAG: hypothetical protein QF414_04745 [Arenicellales bacterium]|jgi:hypothetical protein|nr:hypothetical protein [Arenicellales bacterium]MDP6767981.1 hypothetical protein [Arenicellales bacterium]|tara:strand:- start:487 stop:741 length:255 start_codon:yes stop_codon:yes gene_type:complete
MIPVKMETSPQLLSTTEPEKNLDVVSLTAIWALSPQESERLGQGQYEVSVDLRTADLNPDQYLPDTDQNDLYVAVTDWLDELQP